MYDDIRFSDMKVWCLIIDRENRPAVEPIKVAVSSETDVADLRELVKDKSPRILADTDAPELKVLKCTDPEIGFLDDDITSERREELVRNAFADQKIKSLGPRRTIANEILDEGVLFVQWPGTCLFLHKREISHIPPRQAHRGDHEPKMTVSR